MLQIYLHDFGGKRKCMHQNLNSLISQKLARHQCYISIMLPYVAFFSCAYSATRISSSLSIAATLDIVQLQRGCGMRLGGTGR